MNIQVVSILELFKEKPELLKDKIVDMGWWCDIPYINERTILMLKEHGAKGVIVGRYADYWEQTKVPDNFLVLLREYPVVEEEMKK